MHAIHHIEDNYIYSTYHKQGRWSGHDVIRNNYYESSLRWSFKLIGDSGLVNNLCIVCKTWYQSFIHSLYSQITLINKTNPWPLIAVVYTRKEVVRLQIMYFTKLIMHFTHCTNVCLCMYMYMHETRCDNTLNTSVDVVTLTKCYPVWKNHIDNIE